MFVNNSSQSVPPIRVFSAPSTVDSYINNKRIPFDYSKGIVLPCQIYDQSNGTENNKSTNGAYFGTRSVMIRYSHELFEMNEAVTWKFVVDNVKIKSLNFN